MDHSIREQGYIYFLSEAPELLHTIEKELFTLVEDYSIAKVHTLMRATHTIKGGSANIGLDVINKVAHSLEDVFKALYNPDVKIDAELRSLIFKGFECLQLPLMAELSNTSIDSDEILQRAASVFALLQEKLGSAFSDENYIPSSEELGFDLVLSIFETGVTQRLESIIEVIQNPPDNTEITHFLRSQAEVFLGLAQSLNLPGFEAIAQTTLTALEVHPDLALKIAEIALVDWQQAREAVLAGDRTSGGKPSTALQKLITEAMDNVADVTISLRAEVEEFYKFLIKVGNNKAKAQFYLKVTRYILGWFNHELEIPYKELRLANLICQNQKENHAYDIDNWLLNFIDFMQEEEDSHSLYLYRRGVILTVLLGVAKFLYQRNPSDITMIQSLKTKLSHLAKESKNYPQVTTEEKKWLERKKLQKLLEIREISIPVYIENSNPSMEEIWGQNIISSIEHEEINSDESNSSVATLTVNELLATETTERILEAPFDSTITNHQRVESKSHNSRQPSFVRVDVEGLNNLNYLAGELLIYQKRRTLHDQQLQEIIERLFQQIQRHQNTLTQLGEMPLQMQSFNTLRRNNFAFLNFDALEMDEYTEVHLKLHEATEETLQLQETLESLDLILRQATLVDEKQQHLTLGIIDNLVEARMSPLGNILNRFPQMIQNLGNVYGKSVDLELTGTEVLVDKAITEKLYDPLLQLVRNAFDHGIEPPEIRFKRGKTKQGLIEICAYHQGSHTIIEVRDDGQGLNFDKIRSKAVELNLISTNYAERGDISTPTQDELLEFLFLPGFSTADRVSEISGRGMGLDIVRSQLEALNGSISVQSLPNQGTTFILKIPFSMTTDQLMLIQAGGTVYGLLLESIERVLLPSAFVLKEFEGKKIFHFSTGDDERMVSIRKLSELMHYNCSFKSSAILENKLVIDHAGVMRNPVLLLRHNQKLLGLEVDHIIGEQELVIRPLGQAIAPPKYIYGCSSLANGTLILVIDSTVLLESNEIQGVIDVIALPTDSSQKKALPISVSSIQSTPLLAPGVPGDLNHKIPKIVLVVDDAISLRQTLSLTCQKFGYQVFQAQNGIEALEQLQQHPEVQLVISDLEMPHMNGFELLSNIRKNPDLRNKPVMILTSRTTEKHRQLAQELGATAYLTKPYLEHEFISTVEGLINGVKENQTPIHSAT